jgi:hypothetical protein
MTFKLEGKTKGIERLTARWLVEPAGLGGLLGERMLLVLDRIPSPPES